MDFSAQEKITIFQNLFRAREDVFAVWWQKADGTASGFTPVCINEWRTGVCLKFSHGRCKECTCKEYTKWSELNLKKHLAGLKTFGLYSLLLDNTSYFLAIDFDEGNYVGDVKQFLALCHKYELPTYIERSRSGKGMHVWFFFEDKYSASKSRNIFFHLLREAKIIDTFSREESFDRIFPSQDFLSNDGFGNLIVLPLQGQSVNDGNTIFLDPKSFKPIENQWEYLAKVKKIKIQTLEQLYHRFNSSQDSIETKANKTVQVTLAEQVLIESKNLPLCLANFLKENLNFSNPEYIIKKRMGVGVYNVQRFFNLIESKGSHIGIPRGFFNQLEEYLKEHSIKHKIKDERIKLKSLKLKSSLKLFDYQVKAFKNIMLSDNGILVAPPGSGKTIIGVELIAKIQQPALILVHKKQIFNQWVERIENFLGIPKKEIGQICSNKRRIGDQVTVAMIQTLHRIDVAKELNGKFGLMIVDECHHVPAKMFREVITQLNTHHLYGLTATPDRKYKDERLIFLYLGDVLHEIDKSELTNRTTIKSTSRLEVKINETEFEIPFKVTIENSSLMSKVLVFDTNRNKQIANDIRNEARSGSKCLILTERKEHAEVLNQYFNKEFETIVLTGDLTEKQRREKMAQIQTGNYQILIATGQLLGEGTDIKNLDCLFLVYPFSFHGKLTQYIGRLTRNIGGDTQAKVYDYRDVKVEYLEKLFKKRQAYYRKNFDL